MKRAGAGAAVIVYAMTGAAISGTTWNQAGKGTGVSRASAVEIADGHMLMQISSSYDHVEMEHPDHPMHGASGPCIGSVEVQGQSVSGNGICAFTDTGGEKAVLHWTAERIEASGAMAGTWKLSGGTGKWTNAKGGGNYSSLADPASGALVNTFTSVMTLP